MYGGILSKREEENIRSSMKTLNCRANVNFQHMLAYQMELGYDLALLPNDVVSSNLGFESVLGVFEQILNTSNSIMLITNNRSLTFNMNCS